ncbi:DUF5713 family protein [Streptomyces sp. NPDC052299]|uniref:DUF5713 family protein n=1 Tax=Streptomyces sp. NPDC052299 TaxID=3155054 RepID=UPI003439D052
MPITNQQVAGHAFLHLMQEDPYFPGSVVSRGKAILARLCKRIEVERPADLEGLYVLTQAATEEFNLLDSDSVAAWDGIETVGREWICEEFCFIASAYGYTDADPEELTANRDW